MHYLVLVKQVPDDLTIYLDRDSGLLRRSTTGVQTDPASRNAVEHALQLRQGDDTISVMTKGPARAAESLRQALAMGCDAAYHLCDPAFEGSDLLSTARTLVAAIRHVPTPVDAVLIGDRSADGRTGLLGPMLAEALRMPLAYPEQGGARQGIIIITRDANTPRTPTAINVMKAGKKPLTTWATDDLGLDETQTGLRGSATRVVRSAKREKFLA
ncbi:MAG: hypothetical protein MUD01_18025 [Chloroflexaceae bacterium]|jgi:electron transfer flavoprotein beta subunit|nr:hypothetical protein [Chloroflexaceae bacterium]